MYELSKEINIACNIHAMLFNVFGVIKTYVLFVFQVMQQEKGNLHVIQMTQYPQACLDELYQTPYRVVSPGAHLQLQLSSKGKIYPRHNFPFYQTCTTYIWRIISYKEKYSIYYFLFYLLKYNFRKTILIIILC